MGMSCAGSTESVEGGSSGRALARPRRSESCGCGSNNEDKPGRSGPGKGGDASAEPTTPAPTKDDAKLIGDGSTADTGKQPHQPDTPVPLEPGQTPPQFVIFSWDGAGEVGNGLFPASSNSPRTTTRR